MRLARTQPFAARVSALSQLFRAAVLLLCRKRRAPLHVTRSACNAHACACLARGRVWPAGWRTAHGPRLRWPLRPHPLRRDAILRGLASQAAGAHKEGRRMLLACLLRRLELCTPRYRAPPLRTRAGSGARVPKPTMCCSLACRAGEPPRDAFLTYVVCNCCVVNERNETKLGPPDPRYRPCCRPAAAAAASRRGAHRLQAVGVVLACFAKQRSPGL